MKDICVAVILPVETPEEKISPQETAARLSLLARKAAVFSAESMHYTPSSFLKGENGAPIPENGIYWSISHKPTYVAGAVTTCAVGIDVEKMKPMTKGMFQKVATEKEWNNLGEKTQDSFFRVWTGKEALLKMIGVGYQGISNCNVHRVLSDTVIEISYEKKIWPVYYFRFNGHMAAIVTHISKEIQWKLY